MSGPLVSPPVRKGSLNPVTQLNPGKYTRKGMGAVPGSREAGQERGPLWDQLSGKKGQTGPNDALRLLSKLPWPSVPVAWTGEGV